MRIDLESLCQGAPSCMRLAVSCYNELNRPNYKQGMAVVELPLPQGRTMMKRAKKALLAGYHVKRVEPSQYADDILAVNRSATDRQGRPMDAAYWNYEPTASLMAPVDCPRHANLFYGVLRNTTLLGYASIHRRGELVLVSQYLGHAKHMDDGIMYLLMYLLMAEQELPSVAVYNRYDSGTDGLRFFKDRCGFKEEDVKWALST